MTSAKAPRSPIKLGPAMLVLIAMGLFFGYGVGVGFYHWPPFLWLKKIQDTLIDHQKETDPNYYEGEQELLQFAFMDPLIKDEQILAPITSLHGIFEANKTWTLSVEAFLDAYDQLEIIDTSRLTLDAGATRVLKVSYLLDGAQYAAYAYAVDSAGSHGGAALVIPGSGWNQSSAIYRNRPSNYQFGIINALGPSLDKFVLIKPNEDCLAIHNGQFKLNKDFFIDWYLDMGGSYSAQYITGSLAITKYLQSQYPKVVVAGLSQGGHAALLNALQSKPQVAIISSGFSVVNAEVRWAGHSQVIIPGLKQKLSNDEIRARMREIPTSFLFTFGKIEIGTYKMEAHERLTCEYLSSLPNVECGIHDEGHRYPVEIIREFVNRRLSPGS